MSAEFEFCGCCGQPEYRCACEPVKQKIEIQIAATCGEIYLTYEPFKMRERRAIAPTVTVTYSDRVEQITEEEAAKRGWTKQP